MPVRTVIERGPKGKRAVAFSLEWLGWSRGAKTPDAALETFESYRDRYRPIADLAGMLPEFDAAGSLEIVDDRVGPGSTEFLGHLVRGLARRGDATGIGSSATPFVRRARASRRASG